MKKNNRGFTLVELLAAIVILGILMVLGLPNLLNMLQNNKNKLYITDAQKLISQAELKMRANSSNIERPAEGDCLVFTLLYLDDGVFNTPPNEGKYLKDASYVVVKNNGNDLEYSVTLIEEMKKGGYKGVELTRNTNLESRSSLRYVKSFSKDEIVFVNDSEFDVDYLNSKLGTNYVGEIEVVYDKVDYTDVDVVVETHAPVIKSATITSTSNMVYNSLDATINVKVEDQDDATSDIRIYISRVSFEDALKSRGFEYGSEESFSYQMIFNQEDKGTTVSLFIVAKDTDNNLAKKVITYAIHNNEGPVIDVNNSSLSKSDDDSYNLSTAKLKLQVFDDLDNTSDLNVCMAEGNVASCSNYRKYRDVFGDGDTTLYTFNRNVCSLDGSKLFLTVFVKDSSDLVDSHVFEYTLYANAAPSLNNVVINSNSESFTDTQSLNVKVQIDASDDLTAKSDLDVTLSDGVNTKNVKYDPSSTIDYTFSGLYDGKNRNLVVSVTDSCGYTTTNRYRYMVYKNKAPVEESGSLKVQSKQNDNNLVLKDGTFTVLVEDDLDETYELVQKICYKINNSSVETCLSDYVPYEVSKDFSLNITEYAGQVFHMYSYIKDIYGEVVKTGIVDYTLYDDTNPSLNSVEAVMDSPIDENKVLLSLNVSDYLDTYSVCIMESYNEELVSSTPCSFVGSYSGDSKTNTIIKYTPSWNIEEKKQAISENNEDVYLYVSVKDSHENISDVKKVKVGLYEECNSLDLADTYYEYNPKTTAKISAELCNGKCYYKLSGDNSNNSIEITYTRKITYRDNFAANTKYCPSNNESGSSNVEEFKAHCDFKDCFYNTVNNNYQSKVIGTTSYKNVPWTLSVNGKIYICNSYYNQYLSSYDNGDELITLTKVSDKICKEAVDDGVYVYNNNSTS